LSASIRIISPHGGERCPTARQRSARRRAPTSRQKEKRSMDHFAGLDVSVKDTSVCVVDEAGEIIREGEGARGPDAPVTVLNNPAYHFKRIGLEAGPLSRCRHMQCSKQPINLGAFGQVLGSLTDYNLASTDEDDLSVLRSIAPSHHGYIVEINPKGLCFEIGALHPRCHCRKLSLPGLILLQPKLPLRLPARAARQLPNESTTLRVESVVTALAKLLSVDAAQQ